MSKQQLWATLNVTKINNNKIIWHDREQWAERPIIENGSREFFSEKVTIIKPEEWEGISYAESQKKNVPIRHWEEITMAGVQIFQNNL